MVSEVETHMHFITANATSECGSEACLLKRKKLEAIQMRVMQPVLVVTRLEHQQKTNVRGK